MPQMVDVKAIMNEKPKAITPEDPIHKAAEILHRHDISHLPVIDHNKHMVGHVHTNDVGTPFIKVLINVVMANKVPYRSYVIGKLLGKGHRLPHQTTHSLSENALNSFNETCFSGLFFTAK